jgi:predicted DNA-binding protein (UPF0251 family)
VGQEKAAKLLKLNRTTLVEKIKRYQLDNRDKVAKCVLGQILANGALPYARDRWIDSGPSGLSTAQFLF